MGGHVKNKGNVIRFPRSASERKKILRESEDKRVRLCLTLRIATGWLLVIATFFFLLVNYRMFTPSAIQRLASTAISGLRQHEGDVTTIVYENGSFSDAALYGNGLAYADSDTLYMARPGGLVSQRRQLAYSSMVVESAGDYVLAYDRGGHGATLLNSVAPTAELTLSSAISTGSLSASGQFVLITDEQGYRTAAAVYNARGEEVFKWNSSEYYIVSATLSPDGKTLAALCFKQNGVSLDSHVLFFSVSGGAQTGDAVIPSALGLNLIPLSGTTVAALCDDGLYLADRGSKTAKELLTYSPSDLLAFSANDGMLALATRSYSGTARADIRVLSENGKLSEPISIAEEPSALAVSRAGTAVLTSTGVSVFGSDLTPLWMNGEAVGARRVLLTDDGTVYALYAKNTRLFTANSTESEELTQ